MHKHNSRKLSRHGVEHTHEHLPLLPLISFLALSVRCFFATELALFVQTPLLQRHLQVGLLLAPHLTLLADLNDIVAVDLQVLFRAAPILFPRVIGRRRPASLVCAGRSAVTPLLRVPRPHAAPLLGQLSDRCAVGHQLLLSLAFFVAPVGVPLSQLNRLGNHVAQEHVHLHVASLLLSARFFALGAVLGCVQLPQRAKAVLYHFSGHREIYMQLGVERGAELSNRSAI